MKTSAIICTIVLFAVSAQPADASISIGAFLPGVDNYASEILAFNGGVGKDHAIVLVYRGFDNTAADNVYLLSQCRNAGAVPFVNIVCGSWSYASIIAGSHDGYLRTNARAFRDFGGRILMTIDSEMNLVGGPPASFVSMWRRVHNIFTEEGASNIEWVWSPNYLPANYHSYYPGDAYVHWVGTEGFCWNDGNSAAYLFGAILNDFAARYPHKPAIISYMAGDKSTASAKAQWITNAYSALKGYGNLKAVVWWNDKVGSYDFRVYPTSYQPGAVPAGVTAAYKNAIGASTYLSTLPPYSQLTGGGGTSGLGITPSPSTVPRGSTLSINWTIDGISQKIDAYLGAVTPDGKLYVADSNLRWSTAIRPIARGFNPSGDAAGSLQFQVPNGIPVGTYTIEAVIVPAGTSVTNPGNWLGGGMAASPITVQ
ncbi:MAG: glycosyl hydrolase [bacterium]